MATALNEIEAVGGFNMAKLGRGHVKKPTERLKMEPQIDAEYIDMLNEYRLGERKKRKLDSAPPSPVDHIKAEPIARGAGALDVVNLTESAKSDSDYNPSLPALNAIDIGADSDSESEFDEFEDVELSDANDKNGENSTDEADAGHQAVTISLDESQARSLTRKHNKKQGLPRTTRIAIHKTALIVWMVHSRLRSYLLSSREVRESPVLKNVFTHQVMRELYPPDHLTDFLKSKRLIAGIKSALEEWKLKFHVLRPGLASLDADRGDPADRQAYLTDLFHLRGSSDLLCQGFYAVMRSLGFRARLVCSLQPPDDLGSSAGSSLKSAKSESPIFWTEIWDRWAPGWISADPLTSTVRTPIGSKPSTAIEPKASDRLNIMRYCIAWEKGHARDVSRRYTSHYNARTRKRRLPYFDGDKWLSRLYAYFGPIKYSKADVAEIRELAKYPRREGIPSRVQDFIGHPQYALSNKLRRNEVLRPGATPCGTLANKGKQQPILYIYQRQDILVAHSAQSWYRRGRSIKPGAQAVLRREAKNRLTGESESVGLYTAGQTELYVPPPVSEDGEVPKSQYRTIDIFTESMIPYGAVYIRDPLGAEAAKLLRIDFANAVTNIEFGKRGPQSKYFGVIVAKDNEPSMQLVLQGLREYEREDAERKEQARVLTLWRNYIVGIQIWDRVERMNPQTEKGNNESGDDGSSDGDRYLDSDSSYSSEEPREYDASERPVSSLRSPSAPPRAYNSEALQLEGQISDRAAQPQQRKPTISLDEFGLDPSNIPPSCSAPNTLGPTIHSRTSQALTGKDESSSPGSHSSFSDLDVDEISESEL